jgi:hypothetical protein
LKGNEDERALSQKKFYKSILVMLVDTLNNTKFILKWLQEKKIDADPSEEVNITSKVSN